MDSAELIVLPLGCHTDEASYGRAVRVNLDWILQPAVAYQRFVLHQSIRDVFK
jgi:hypothetical protein